MKKPIQITEKNAAAIEAALAEVNGRAGAHAYTSFSEIEQLAKAAEARLSALGILKKNAQGARWTETSGSEVSNAYAKKSRSLAAGGQFHITRVNPRDAFRVGRYDLILAPGRL